MTSNSIIALLFCSDEIALLSMNVPFCDGEEDGADYKITNLLKDNNESYVIFIYFIFSVPKNQEISTLYSN